MRINWKIRARNPQFWFQMALAIAVPVGAYFGLTGADLTTWSALWSVIFDAISNPYVLFTIAVSVYNATTDPTTRGINDTKRVMRYDEPGGDV